MSQTSKTKTLRDLFLSKDLTYVMEAHNGISAKIVENSGFEAIWASGLSIASSLGLRDCNEASWTQIVDILDYMNDATNIPILVDGDTGYGNYNSVRMLVKKLSQRGMGGVCLEDKLFPKTNSFIPKEQKLAKISEFCGKIMAAKDTQTDPNFTIVARTETFITGGSLEEALKRAECYKEAGADAIIVHSKKKNANEVLEFARHWKNALPLILIPTTYYNTATEDFVQEQVSALIFANHNLRASLTFMEKICRQIYQDGSIRNVENRISGINDIFDLLNYSELNEAEKKYLNNTPNE